MTFILLKKDTYKIINYNKYFLKNIYILNIMTNMIKTILMKIIKQHLLKNTKI